MKFTAPLLFCLLPAVALVVGAAPPRVIDASRPPATVAAGSTDHAAGSPAPDRVVIFPPALWSYLTLDPHPNHIAAAAEYLREVMAGGLLGQVFPEISNVPVVATQGKETAIPGDPEQLLMLHPDAVLTWRWFSASLVHAGLPVVSLDVDARRSDRDNMFAEWLGVAAIANNVERANALVSRYNDEVAAVAAMPHDKHVPTALILTVYGLETMYVIRANETLKAVGASAPRSGATRGRIDVEQLLQLDPDFIFLKCCFGTDSTPSFFYDRAQFVSLKAVRCHQIYREPTGGSRMEGLIEEPLLFRWMAELINPEGAGELFRDKLKAAYRAIYDYDLTDGQVDQILFFGDNGRSANYDRFREKAMPR